jgi:hypothetical protein
MKHLYRARSARTALTELLLIDASLKTWHGCNLHIYARSLFFPRFNLLIIRPSSIAGRRSLNHRLVAYFGEFSCPDSGMRRALISKVTHCIRYFRCLAFGFPIAPLSVHCALGGYWQAQKFQQFVSFLTFLLAACRLCRFQVPSLVGLYAWTAWAHYCRLFTIYVGFPNGSMRSLLLDYGSMYTHWWLARSVTWHGISRSPVFTMDLRPSTRFE